MEMPTTSQTTEIQRTWMPLTTGILSIVAGAFGLIYGLVLVLLFSFVASMMGLYGTSDAEARIVIMVFQILGIPLIILGIVAIIGGIYALKRRVWGMALAGAICAIFSPFSVLGILSIIFVSISKKEFGFGVGWI